MGARSVVGMILKYDPDAAKRSKQDLAGFLAEKLAPLRRAKISSRGNDYRSLKR